MFDWVQGYKSIALVAEVFMFPISLSPLIMDQILWRGCIHKCPDLLVYVTKTLTVPDRKSTTHILNIIYLYHTGGGAL